jgi:hypothetical protein
VWESASSHAEERAKLLDSRLWIIMFADLSNWFVDRRVRAQGNALGMKSSKSRCALKGPVGAALSGRTVHLAAIQGRCPGLVTSAPLARQAKLDLDRAKLLQFNS